MDSIDKGSSYLLNSQKIKLFVNDSKKWSAWEVIFCEESINRTGSSFSGLRKFSGWM